MAAWMAGCAELGPDYARPTPPVASHWLDAGAPRLKTRPSELRLWWKVFQDPVLDRLIETAYRQNLPLQAAGVRVLEARARLGAAVGNLYPQVQQALGSLQYNRLSQTTLQGTFAKIFAYTQSQLGFNASWEIDFWGRFRRAVESADYSLLASLADYDSALVTLTADVATNYILFRTAQQRLAIARHNVETQRESLKIAEARFQGGTTSQRDVEQARTVLASTEATIPALEIAMRQSTNALSILMGQPPKDLSRYLAGSAGIPSAPPAVIVGIPADLLRRRPDIQVAELQAAAQSAQIGITKAELYPAFSLSGQFGLLAADVGKYSLGDMFNWQSRFGAIGPTVRWNILNYGQITNQVRAQDARFQELLLQYQNAVLTAQREVEDSLVAFLKSEDRARSLRESTEAALRSLDLAVLQYRQGITDFTTVLTAQQSLLTEQDNLASTLGDIARNLVGVYRALGGGWQIREGNDLLPENVKKVMAERTDWGKLLTPATYLQPPAPKHPVRAPDW
ncbi:efflux transporter outer membrane subunit [Candidatus Methylocalor cossyra]|uniref:efflux transporter outer membrane subunit n=1 Tax=Candidatus Methylocalor cossyra TaxID=3108543 RepID=UPI003D6CB107